MRISDWSSDVCSSDLNLVVESVIVPPGAVPGETIEVLYVVRNTGTAAAAAPWTDRIYIDDDQTISGAATLTSLPRNFNLAPGETYEIRQNVTIPSAYTDGEWRIFVRADAQSIGRASCRERGGKYG